MSKKPLPSIPRTERSLDTKWGSVTYRSWGLGDQSLILQAVSPSGEGDEEERAQALVQLLRTNTLKTNSKLFSDIADAPIFVAELVLMRMRALALGEKATVSRVCDACPEDALRQRLDFEFDINKDIVIEEDQNHRSHIVVGVYKINLKYPTIQSSLSLQGLTDAANASVVLTSKFVASVETDDEFWDMSDYEDDEIKSFIEDMGSDVQTDILQKFVATMPYTKVHLETTCPQCGKVHSFDVRGVSRLFTV